jgi:hypothetical protein
MIPEYKYSKFCKNSACKREYGTDAKNGQDNGLCPVCVQKIRGKKSRCIK